jgi:hypothetical protein
VTNITKNNKELHTPGKKNIRKKLAGSRESV